MDAGALIADRYHVLGKFPASAPTQLWPARDERTGTRHPAPGTRHPAPGTRPDATTTRELLTSVADPCSLLDSVALRPFGTVESTIAPFLQSCQLTVTTAGGKTDVRAILQAHTGVRVR